MAMMKYNPVRGVFLARIVEAGGFVAGGEAPKMRKMFGHDTWFLNGYMFTGANEDGVYVHLGEEGATAAIAESDELAPFSPGRDMIMKNYGLIVGAGSDDEAVVASWVSKSAGYLTSLPKKEPKKKSRKRR